MSKSARCVDRFAGDILAGWRYDISGIAPEMRTGYEEHLAECEFCRSRQRMHRRVDVALVVLTTAAAAMFVVAFGAVYHFQPKYSLLLQIAALGGFAISVLMLLLVAIATPAPVVMVDVARNGARRLHATLPEEIREKLPPEVKAKLL